MDAALAAFAGGLPVAGALVIIACLFRSKFETLIDRVKRLNIAGSSADLGQPQQQQVEQEAQPELPIAPPGRPAASPPPLPILEPVERNIRGRLEATAPNDVQIQLEWAVRLAADAMVDRDMEVTYRVIFGSQIAALKEMNMRGGALTVARAKEIYEMAKARFPDMYENFSFESWSEFPLIRGLAERPAEPITPQSRVLLNDGGRQFLHFLTGKGLLEYKSG